jgi:hypothetical protein
MRIILSSLCAIAMAAFLLSSCTKNSIPPGLDPDEIGKYCRIDTFNLTVQQMQVTYNSSGDPVSIVPLTSYLYGEAFDLRYFRYDARHRLVDFFYVFPSVPFGVGDIDLWHRYTYPAPNVIVDSFFNYDGPGIPPVDNPPSGYVSVTVSRYQLDLQGRTVKTDVQYISNGGNTPSSYTTTYDRNGNQVIAGAMYDDKININRTNSVWQLINQDYSLNNRIFPATGNYPASILSYNKWELPGVFTSNPTYPNLPFFGSFYDNLFYMGVSYSCDQTPPPSSAK